MDNEVLKAVPRPVAIKWIVFSAVIGLALVLFGQKFLFPWIREYLTVENKDLALSRFKVVMCGIGVALLPPVIFLFWFASRIIKSRQFPHPRAIVFRDTPIVRGPKAVFRGWAIGLGALFILGCAIYAAYLPFMLFGNGQSLPAQRVIHTEQK